jgi:V-type H+-transporting ATPase subunit a
MPGLGVAVKVRYLIILMGFFAVFGGFIYNDFASLPWNLFGSCYKTINKEKREYSLEPGCVYPFGTEPVYHDLNTC